MNKLVSMSMTMVLTLVLVVPALAQTAPTISINPTSGSGGTTVMYEGTGYTPNGEATVVISADGLIVDDTVADDSGAISGSFSAPDRDDITGESTNNIPVFAIDEDSAAESNRVTFTYVQKQLPDTGSRDVSFGLVVAVLALLITGGVALRRLGTMPRG
jgi:LPXTG-motif cell wall-anchored protein